MENGFTPTARRLGIYSASLVVTLLIAYAITLGVGFYSLDSAHQPIADPMFTILEVIIIVLLPAMLTLMIAVHAWGPPRTKVMTLCAIVFMALVAAVTCSVHFVILTASRHPMFVDSTWATWAPLMFSFEWPSVAYALDILAWDIFFALSMLFAAPALTGSRLAITIRVLMIISGILALAGLSGVVTGDMRLRNIGIIGYVPVFLVIAGMLAILFARTKTHDP